MGQMAASLVQMGAFLRCDVLGYDYSGYGTSSGSPSEKNVYADAEAAFESLKVKWGVKPEKIILYGQSIGTGPTVHLAAKHRVAGVVIHSGFASAVRVVFPNKSSIGCCAPGNCCDDACDIFVNVGKCKNIKSPVLVIHGKSDEFIHIKHGRQLYEACPVTVEPLWVPHADHNNVTDFSCFWFRLKKFVDFDLEKEKTLASFLNLANQEYMPNENRFEATRSVNPA